MSLWILKRKYYISGHGNGVSNGFVIRASSEKAARQLLKHYKHLVRGEGIETWLNPDESTCEKLTANGKEDIILWDITSG